MGHILQFVLVVTLAQTPALNSTNVGERRQAVESMAVLGNRDAIPRLADAYRNEPRSDLRRSIASGLGRIRDVAAIPVLTEILETDYNKDVRLQAIDSFLRLYIPTADERGIFSFVGRVREAFSATERPLIAPNVRVDAAAEDALVNAMLDDFDPEVRAEAAYGLGSLGATGRISSLALVAEGPRNQEMRDVRIAAIRSMGVLAHASAGPTLTRLMRDGDDRVAREAIQAVGRTGYREAYGELATLFQNTSNSGVRESALHSIALLREPQAVALLESQLDSREEKLRELSTEGLARLGYDAAPFVQRIATERNDGVRLAQAFALAAAGEQVYVGDLVAALDTRRSSQAEVYLYELGRFEGKLDYIFPHLRNPDTDIRAGLVRVLGQIGDPAARPHIEPLTQDRNTAVMREAVEALRKLNP